MARNPPKLQTAADVPPEVAVPDELDTRLGKLTFIDASGDEPTANTLGQKDLLELTSFGAALLAAASLILELRG